MNTHNITIYANSDETVKKYNKLLHQQFADALTGFGEYSTHDTDISNTHPEHKYSITNNIGLSKSFGEAKELSKKISSYFSKQDGISVTVENDKKRSKNFHRAFASRIIVS